MSQYEEGKLENKILGKWGSRMLPEENPGEGKEIFVLQVSRKVLLLHSTRREALSVRQFVELLAFERRLLAFEGL